MKGNLRQIGLFVVFLSAALQFKINREDFGIETESAGGGTVKVAKEIKVSFDIVAVP